MTANWFALQASTLEPDALEPFNFGMFSYSIPSGTTKALVASFSTRIGMSGRLEVRHPREPLFLSGVTIVGLQSSSGAITLDPSKPTYADAQGIYYDRLSQLANAQLQYLPLLAANTIYDLLPGPYGSIITRACNFDFTWLASLWMGTYGINLDNEINDSASVRQDSPLRFPISKITLTNIKTGISKPADQLGGICYVLLPSTWSCVTDLLAPYDFRDDFMLPALDTATWNRTQSSGGNLEIHAPFAWLLCKGGTNTWGSNGMCTNFNILRADGKALLFDVYLPVNASEKAMIGWSDGLGVSYTNLAHGLYFSGGSVNCYENGTSRAGGGTVLASQNIYRFRLTLSGPSCVYEMQGGSLSPIGGLTWTNISPTISNSATNMLSVGLAVYAFGSIYVGDIRVYG